MEHKVTISSQMGMGITISHEFSKIIDTEEEAQVFGEEAQKFSAYFLEGFGNNDD